MAALAGGGVRILPWLLDPQVTWRVAAPFARSVFVLAGEVALALGWPIGWALAAQLLVERGEAGVLRLLGERPARTGYRLVRHGAVLAAVLAAMSLASARESTEPGRIVSELIRDGQVACRSVDAPRTYVVPFFGAAWLCAPGTTPRLAGQGPGPLASLVFTATDARASGDLAYLELDDVNVALPRIVLHVGNLSLRGAPWGHGQGVAPFPRAASLTVAVGLSAWAAVVLILRGVVSGRIAALVVGSSGPLAALAALRGLERLAGSGDAHPSRWLTTLVPFIALAVLVAVTAGIAAVVSRLPLLRQAASK
jgi:hypothetical protein